MEEVVRKFLLVISLLPSVLYAESGNAPIYNFNFYNGATPNIKEIKSNDLKDSSENSVESTALDTNINGDSDSEKLKENAVVKDVDQKKKTKEIKTGWNFHLMFNSDSYDQTLNENNATDFFSKIIISKSSSAIFGVSYAGFKLAYGVSTLWGENFLNDEGKSEIDGSIIIVEYDQPISHRQFGFFGGFSSSIYSNEDIDTAMFADSYNELWQLTRMDIESTSLYLGFKYQFYSFTLGLALGRNNIRTDIYASSMTIDPNYDELFEFSGQSSELKLRLAYTF